MTQIKPSRNTDWLKILSIESKFDALITFYKMFILV